MTKYKASEWASRSRSKRIPGAMETVFDAVQEERFDRIQEWDNRSYLVVPNYYTEPGPMGYGRYVLEWLILVPGSKQTEGDCQMIFPNPLDFMQRPAINRVTTTSPVFEKEETAQDFACALNLGRGRRLNKEPAQHFRPLVIDDWIEECYRELVLNKNPMTQGLY